MNDILLYHTINLNKYILNIYYVENDIIPTNLKDSLGNMYDELNSMEYPSNLVEKLEPLLGCKKLDIYDLDNNLLLSSVRLEP